jgi:hypothetical protein
MTIPGFTADAALRPAGRHGPQGPPVSPEGAGTITPALSKRRRRGYRRCLRDRPGDIKATCWKKFCECVWKTNTNGLICVERAEKCNARAAFSVLVTPPPMVLAARGF